MFIAVKTGLQGKIYCMLAILQVLFVSLLADLLDWLPESSRRVNYSITKIISLVLFLKILTVANIDNYIDMWSVLVHLR